MIREYTSKRHYDEIIEASFLGPVLLLKHSSICPISATAHREFVDFSEANEDKRLWLVLVRENRSLSVEIADKTGIRHQSPQVILFHMGKPIWDCSHGKITHKNLNTAVTELTQ